MAQRESDWLRHQVQRANATTDQKTQWRAYDRVSRNDQIVYKWCKYPLFRATEQSDNSPKPVYYNVGTLSLSCQHCGALHYATESLPGHATMLHNCFQNGKIDIPKTLPFPEKLRMLFTTGDRLSNRFFEHIDQYNSGTAFAWFRASIASPSGHGLYSFHIQRQIYYSATTALHIIDGQVRKYAQYYVLDSNEALINRLVLNTNCDKDDDKTIMEIIDSAHYVMVHTNRCMNLKKNKSKQSDDKIEQ
jgi:hypothetical protein